MKYIYIVFIFLYNTSLSQFRGNNWIFGDSISLHFDGIAQPTMGYLNSDIGEAYANVSDSAGNLLFYSGTRTANQLITYVYDRNGGYLLNSAGTYGFSTVTQGNIIIPFPGNNNLFYLFAISWVTPGNPLKLYYNIIDMSQNAGMGTMVQKNILLCDSNLCEMMNAVRHANGRDWWLVIHQRYSSNYLLYLISPSGISGPFIQNIGLVINNSIIGESIFAEDGSRFAHAMNDGNLQLLDFDRCTGTFSNCQQLGDSLYAIEGNYGCSFSPNGSKLYVSDQVDSLFQYDLLSPDVKASRSLIYCIHNADYIFGQHQLAEDGKIYIADANINSGNTIDSISTSLSVINLPDSSALSCSFSPFSISMDQRITYAGLPNNPNYALGPVAGSICDSLTTTVASIDKENGFQIYPNPADTHFTLKNSLSQKAVITVVDVKGTVMLNEEIKESNKNINICELPAGIYIVNVLTDTTSTRLKLVKVNGKNSK
jgi:hypothetical protein